MTEIDDGFDNGPRMQRWLAGFCPLRACGGRLIPESVQPYPHPFIAGFMQAQCGQCRRVVAWVYDPEIGGRTYVKRLKEEGAENGGIA